MWNINVGIGLMDYMVKSQTDPETGDTYVDFGVYNDDMLDNEYRKFRTNVTEENAIYVVKAQAPLNTEAHTILQSNLNTGKVKFLQDERAAKLKLMNKKIGASMSPEERAEYLKPFTLTSILREELLNLREENEGINIILRQANKGIKKDKVSSLEYGLYYINKEEENSKRKKKFKASDWSFLN